MFIDRKQKKAKSYLAVAGACTLALAVTLGYCLSANAAMQASVSRPALRTEYKNSVPLDGAVELTNGDRKINVSLRESDLKQTLRMIADKAGLNIIFHSSVAGTVTLDLVNVTLNDAFKMILQANDLTYFMDKGTLVVMSKAASMSSDMSKQNMMTLPVKYADASKLAAFLNSNVFSRNRPGLSNGQIVVTNPQTNELIIFGTSNDYKMAQKIVAKLDVKPQTVSFRVNHTTPKEMAELICSSLFPNDQSAGGGSSGGGSSSGGFGGFMTGGAAELGGGGSSGGSSSGGGGGSSLGENMALGGGVVACSVNNNLNANGLVSLQGSALTVTYFPQTGTITVTGGSESQADMVKDFIAANDKKQPQAYVEVQIVELSENGSKDFQNTWALLTPFVSTIFDGDRGLRPYSNAANQSSAIFFTGRPFQSYAPATEGSDGSSSSSQGAASTNYFRYHGKSTVSWAINYLIKNGKGRMLANPKVMVTNGKKSVINLTSDYVKTTEEEIMTSGTVGTAGVSRTYEIGEDNGISVELVPFISPDGYVTMNLMPNYATIKEQIMAPSSTGQGQIIAATLLQRRNLELSNIRIKDGETLVLGGLIQEEEHKNISKLPLLGDLPVIGSVFRSTTTTNTKSELVIMITPHIIKDTDDVASAGENL